MKYLSILFITAPIWLLPAQAGETLEISVTLPPSVKARGILKVGVYTDSETFLDSTRMYRMYRFPVAQAVVRDGALIFHLKGLTLGSEYAFVVSIDQNGNDIFDRSRLAKFPLEPYGFSGKPPGFRKPRYKECAFIYTQNTTLSIALQPPMGRQKSP